MVGCRDPALAARMSSCTLSISISRLFFSRSTCLCQLDQKEG